MTLLNDAVRTLVTLASVHANAADAAEKLNRLYTTANKSLANMRTSKHLTEKYAILVFQDTIRITETQAILDDMLFYAAELEEELSHFDSELLKVAFNQAKFEMSHILEDIENFH
jgi:uncharacterized protein YacL (UPF0231 family)